MDLNNSHSVHRSKSMISLSMISKLKLNKPNASQSSRSYTRSASSASRTSRVPTATRASASFCAARYNPQTNETTDWMYWQRDASNPQSWTKVFAVLENEFLWLYQNEVRHANNVLIQIAVASVELSGDNSLTVFDPNDESLVLALYESSRIQLWRNQLQEAAQLTTAYFRVFALTTKDLARDSVYRGSLVSYRKKESTRTRYKAAFRVLFQQCKKALVSSQGQTATITM